MSAFYRCMGGNGGGVTPTSITPSNSTPASMSSGGVYQPTANGYAIESYDSKTPSDSTPPSVASGDIVKMGGAGYLYASQQQGVKTGSLTIDSTVSKEYTINTGLSSITHFDLHAYSNKSNYGTGMQFYNRWDSDDSSNQYILSRYASNGTTSKTALSTTAIATAITIESVNGGTVKIKSPSNNNWTDLSLKWLAY